MDRRVTISLFYIILLSIGLTAIPGQAEDVSLSDVHQAVRQTIERELKGFKVDNVERDEDDGKIVYELEVENNDQEIQLKINRDGTLLEKQEQLDDNDLPEAVLNAVKKAFGDIDIDDVEKRYQLGRKPYYKVEGENDKFEADLEIAEDGTILKKEIDEKGDDDDLPGEFRRIRRTVIQLIDQLQIVALGDSRTQKGVDPQYFLGEENQKYPLAITFGSCAKGMGAVELLCEDYFAHGRKMKWVIYGLSPRIMNKYYRSGGWDDNVKECDIYYTDKNMWATIPKVTRMIPFSEVDIDKGSQWGFDGNERIKKDLLRNKDERRDALRELQGKGRYEFDLERLAMLESSIKKLGENGVNMLAF
ncbi:MAG: PepSY domain-containing protein, partial [Planctomycetota bacterium]